MAIVSGKHQPPNPGILWGNHPLRCICVPDIRGKGLLYEDQLAATQEIHGVYASNFGFYFDRLTVDRWLWLITDPHLKLNSEEQFWIFSALDAGLQNLVSHDSLFSSFSWGIIDSQPIMGNRGFTTTPPSLSFTCYPQPQSLHLVISPASCIASCHFLQPPAHLSFFLSIALQWYFDQALWQ